MVDIDELNRVIARSEEFEGELFQLLESSSFVSNNKSTAILAMCDIAQEHATSFKGAYPNPIAYIGYGDAATSV